MSFFEKLDEINQSLNRSQSPEQRLKVLLRALLTLFDADRAWLIYPCDPDSKTYSIPLQITKPVISDFTSEKSLNSFANSTLMTDLMNENLHARLPVLFEYGHPLINLLNGFGIRAQMSMALFPEIDDRPWLVGIHQFDGTDHWTKREISLFTLIAGMMVDILNNWLVTGELVQQKDQYRSLFEFSQDGLATFDLDGNLLTANQTYCNLTGHSLEELLTCDPKSIIHPDSLHFFDEFLIAMRAGKSFQCEGKQIHKNGTLVDIEVFASLVKYQGQSVGLVRLRNVSERKVHEQMQEKALSVQRGILEATVDGILVVDSKLNVISYNNKFVEISQIPSEILQSRDSRQFFMSACAQIDKPGKFKHQVNSIYAQPEQTVRDIIHLKNERVVEFYSQSYQLDNKPQGRVWSFRDITDAHRLAEQLSYQACHDPLTGLINRREFERRLNCVLHPDLGEQVLHVLCFMDLDKFKLVNDTCGHVAGDELLKQLADLMLSYTRAEDALGRLGGDEFALLLHQCTLQQAEIKVQAIRKEIADYVFCWDNYKFNIAVSIGMVPVTKQELSVDTLLIQADTACYAAKSTGRNRIHLYSEEDEIIGLHYSEMDRLNQIQQALHGDGFQLWAQPITSIGNTDPGEHLEILLRMEQYNGVNLLPGIFFPIAERYNLASRIDHWVINKVLQWFKKYPQKLANVSLLTINLSGQSLSDKSLLKFIETSIYESGFPRNKLCFEITETAAISNYSEARKFIDTLRNIGCSFALDDFGSGLSSFSYLKNLPVDFLKIDGQFVRDMADDPIDYAMVKSINEIGRVMGKKTIAEFVETGEILQKLTELGVDYAQGYHFGRPLLLKHALE